MNKDGRKALSKLQDRLTSLKVGVDELAATVAQIHDDIETLRDEEQEKYDNLPEALQGSGKGETMCDCIASLESAMSHLEEYKDTIEGFEIDAPFSDLDEAKGIDE